MAMSATAANGAGIAAATQAEIIAGNANLPLLIQQLAVAIQLVAQAVGSDTPVYTGPTFTAQADNAAVSLRLQP